MNSQLLQFAATIVVRVTLVLVIAGLISMLLRRASAALRHWVWVLAMGAALMMPALVMMAPRWDVALPNLPQDSSEVIASTTRGNALLRPTAPAVTLWDRRSDVAASVPTTTTVEDTPVMTPNVVTPPVQTTLNQPTPHANRWVWPDWKTGVLFFWILGAGVVALTGVRQYQKVARLGRASTMSHPAVWQSETEHLRELLHIRRPIQLVMTSQIVVPMTIGLRKPIILLPADAVEWTPERRWVVLVHEGIHIARWDALMGWLALGMCALHWFNPLAWIATRRLAVEGETACDDRVLQMGTAGPDYAAHLLAIAQKVLKGSELPVTPGMARMAQSGNLSQRVRGILDKGRARGASRRQRAIGLVLILTLVTPLTTIATPQSGDVHYPHIAHADDDVTLTVALPEDFLNVLNREALALDDFEAAHPGVKVVLRRDDSGYMENPVATDAEAYLNDMMDYADSADVLFDWTVDYVTPVATRAGLLLDLAPLVAVDPDFDESRYFAGAWQSYQWDNGIWALPMLQDPVFVVYNRPAFDAAGLTYPDEHWTMDQYVAAAQALTTTNAEGQPVAGLSGDPTYLIRALLGRPFYHMTNPADPTNFAGDPELIALAQQWVELAQAGQAVWYSDYDVLSPLQIMASWAMTGDYKTPDDDGDWGSALLPGGVASVMNVSAFAVSAGTASPEMAYELAKYLSLSSKVFLSNMPIAGMSAVLEPGSTPDNPITTFASDKNPAQQAADLLAAQHAIPLSERMLVTYLIQALNDVAYHGGDLLEALQRADTQSSAALALAEEKRPTVVLSIPPVEPPVQVPDGQVALQFHMMTGADNIPNFDQWQQAAADFAAQDDEVFSIDLLTGWGPQEGQPVDCYMQSDPYAPELLNLEPLMAADAAFDANDFAPGILDAVKQDGKVVGYPLTLLPASLWINQAVVEQTGVSLPTDDWDITTFVEALTALKDSGQAPASMAFTYDGNELELIMLMAAYGALPIDYRTNPATLDLTSPANVEAIQRVLDLVKDGYIIDPATSSIEYTAVPIAAGTYYNFSFNLSQSQLSPGLMRVMNYPSGHDFAPMTFAVQAGYINQSAQSPEACYRWLRYIAGRSDLLMGIPARRTVLNDPMLDSTFGPELATSFRDYYARLDAPNVLQVPFSWNSNERLDTAVGLWVQEAFDAYLDDTSDLESALTLAQQRSETYMACMVDAPTEMTTPEEIQSYMDFMLGCAQGVDPDILTKEPFSYMYGAN